MGDSFAVAFFLGVLAALIGRLQRPYQSAVWCLLVTGSIGIWIIGLSIGPTLLTGMVGGFALHFLFAFTFVVTSFAMEHVTEMAAKRRLS